MSLRSVAVQKAREEGICTQCLKNKAAEDRRQCQRCIDKNREKRLRKPEQYSKYQATNFDRSLSTEASKKVINFCIKNKICTRCHVRYTDGEFRNCERCLARKRKYKTGSIDRKKVGRKNKAEVKKAEAKTKQTVREKQREYKRKALVEKVRKLDRIRYAVEKGKEL